MPKVDGGYSLLHRCKNILTRQKKRKLHLKLPLVVILCGGITDYRTFINDFRKCAEFVRWLKEKTEGWDSQSCDSVFITTSDTPISSVMTADFLYPTKAKACVRSYFDKHRVNHLDSHPDLSAISSLNHGWLFCSVKNYWKEVVGIVPDVLRYAIPLFGYG